MLLITIVFLFSLLCINGENTDKLPLMSTRIINGKVTNIANFTHQARLDSKSGMFICGGTIIADNAILTAAHCIIDGGISVRVGADSSRNSANQQSGTVVEVKKTEIHPEFNPDTLEHDLAVVLLKNNITYGARVGKLEMAAKNGDFPQPATVVGWGCTACLWFIPAWLCILPPSKQLRFGELSLDRHFGHKFESKSRVKSCPGDSGGPVINKDGKLIGVISYMDAIFSKNRPNYFMSVPDHLNWIKETIGQQSSV